ncbi:bromodomain-containing protein 4B-like isoform X2 [Eriocheir sinensis]|nr:bromodomain-containing protein 4B-like isoform X2 [Eriocheir sinensis]
MAGPMPLQGDRSAWCRERLDFFCAVINNVDRESLKAELEACETEEDAAGLMHSLLWLQDNTGVQATGGAMALDPSAPNVEDEAYPEEVLPFFVAAEDPPACQPQYQRVAHQGLLAAAPEHYVIFQEPQHPRDHEPQHPRDHEPQHPRDHEPQHPRDHEPQHPRDHEPQHPRDHETQHLRDHEPQHPRDHEPQNHGDQEPHHLRDHEPQHLREQEPQHFIDHDYEGHHEYQQLNNQQLQQQQEDDIEDYQDLPPEGEVECHMLQDAPRLNDHDLRPQQEYRQQQERQQEEHHEQQQQEQYEQQEQQEQQQHEHHEQYEHQQEREMEEEAEFIIVEPQPQPPPQDAAPESALDHDLAGDHDLHDPPRPQELPEDHAADDPPSNSVDDDHFEDIPEDQMWGAQAEPLPLDQQSENVPDAAGSREREGGGDDAASVEPISEKSDPYFDADESAADDFVDVEDDSMIASAAQRQDEEAAAGGLDVDGATGGGPAEEDNMDAERLTGHGEEAAPGGLDTGGVEMEGLEEKEEEEEDTMNDERLARQLSEAINAEELARMERDEQLARELAEEMEREQQQQEAEDEELARRLAEEESEEENQPRRRRQDINPPVEIIFAEAQDNPPPPPPAVTLEAVPPLEVEGDAEMARQLEAELHVREEDEKAERVVALINMFPDADPHYLTERMEGQESEEAFRQVVEAMLLCQRTEPRMSGYQKLLKQTSAAAHHDPHDDQEPAQAIALSSTSAAAAASRGQVFECTICFEEAVPTKDMGTCNALYSYHEFCIECIRKHVAALIGQGHSSFRCMNGYCEAEFSWRTLRRVMEPVVYRKVQERRQQEEVMAAGVEDLVSCPFCCFMIIMPNPENKVLECLNPECLKESCRVCKETSHIPLRCEEVERETQKDARTMLENRMAEAMIRQCPKCGKRFVTEGGCNKMTCSCGTVMCYLCKKVITDGYNHFEQRGGFVSSKCPLWSNATELHTGEVRQAAAEGREELQPGMTLVHDPTRDLL